MPDQREGHRTYWDFTVSKEALIEAVNMKIDHHIERLVHWEQCMAEAERNVREKGIDFRESARPMTRDAIRTISAANQVGTAYFQQPTLHQEFITTLQEAQWKVDEHREKLKEFRHWASALPHGPATYTLTFYDVTYFGL